MAFADEVAKPVIDSYLLARFTFNWLIPSSDWTLVDTNVYRAIVPYRVAGVTLNGTALTSTGSYPPASGRYAYDQAGDLGTPDALYVYDSIGTPNSASGNAVIVSYYQFASSGGDRRHSSNPATAFAGDEDYAGRILQAGPFSQSWENAIVGVQTTSSSAMTLANADNWIQEHLDSSRNVVGGSVSVWRVANSTAGAVFTGIIDSASISGRQVQLSLLEKTGLLDSPAYMGDTASDAFIKSSYALGQVTQPAAVGLPLKYVAGRYGYIKYIYQGTEDLWVEEAEPAYCVHYTGSPSTTTQRKWVLCRLPTSSFRTQTIGTVLNEYSAGGGADWYIQFSSHDLMVGEWIKITNGGTDYFGLVKYVLTTGVSTSPGLTLYNVIVQPYNGAFATPSASTITPLNKPAVFIRRTFSTGVTQTWPIHPNWISVAYTATSGGNYIATLTLSNSIATINYPTFEVTFSALDPDNDQILFFGGPSGSVTHGTAAQNILEGAGLTVDTASITAADAGFAANAAFTIPFHDETEFGTHRSYLQAVALSAGAYVRIDQTSGEASYNLIEAAASSTAIGDDEIIAGSLSVSVAGSDLAHTIYASNPHVPTPEGTLGKAPDIGTVPPSSFAYATDDEAKAFRDRAKSVQLTHVLETVEDRIDYLLSLRSSPITSYAFSTASMHATAALGDDVTIETEQIPGGSVNAKIVGLAQDARSVNVTAVELP